MNYLQKRYLLLALDPVHIGTGGYRLGRVDLSIAREPGTNLPKIPGTSLAGAVRSYAAMRYGKPDCAGQGQASETRQEHCGKPSCPICYTFGYAKDAGGGFAGTVSLSDAHLLLFPVYSMAGPVWVSTQERLNEAGFAVSGQLPTAEKNTTTLTNWNKPSLNLGWLLLEVAGGAIITPPTSSPFNEEQLKLWQSISERIVLTSEKLFSQIVNSNLEVRTSVSINPHTGAAEEHALFTYEAIPRAAWLCFDTVEDDYRRNGNASRPFPTTKQFQGETLNATWTRPLDVVEAGLDLIQYLGVGGMGTRGFGRVQVAGSWQIAGGAA